MPATDSFQPLTKEREPSYEFLVCIYTCEKHQDLLKAFYGSVIGAYLRELPNAKILEVYANPNISQSSHMGNELFLRTVEEYEALSLKTQKMMDYCVQHFDFKRLLKIDVTTVTTRFDSPEYEGRKALDLEKLLIFLKTSPIEKDYDGFILHARVSRKNAENWARKKGGVIDFEKLFGDVLMPPYYTGKCYAISHRFAQFISDNGRDMAEHHVQHLMGSEDVMIGRLYEQFKKAHCT